jgi:hypothetical protein
LEIIRVGDRTAPGAVRDRDDRSPSQVAGIPRSVNSLEPKMAFAGLPGRPALAANGDDSEDSKVLHNSCRRVQFVGAKSLNTDGIELDARMVNSVCDNQWRNRSQVVDSKDGEMSEWLKEHAWKLTPDARADATKSHQHTSDQRVPATWIRVDVSS